MRGMHPLVHVLDLVNELSAIVGIVNGHVILLRPLLLLESLHEAVSAVLVHMAMCSQVVYYVADHFICLWGLTRGLLLLHPSWIGMNCVI